MESRDTVGYIFIVTCNYDQSIGMEAIHESEK